MKCLREDEEYGIPLLNLEDLETASTLDGDQQDRKGDNMEKNIIKFFCHIFKCEKVIEEKNRFYEFRLITTDNIEDEKLIADDNIKQFLKNLVKSEQKDGKKENIMSSEGELDIFKALESDKKLYSNLIVEKEKSIAIKTKNCQNFYIFDANQELWLEEPDKRNFEADNYIIFSFGENNKTKPSDEITKTEDLIKSKLQEVVKHEAPLGLKFENNNNSDIPEESKTTNFDGVLLDPSKLILSEEKLNYNKGKEKDEPEKNIHGVTQTKDFEYKDLKIFYKNNEINKNGKLIRTFFDFKAFSKNDEDNKNQKKSPKKNNNLRSKNKETYKANYQGKECVPDIEKNDETQIIEEEKALMQPNSSSQSNSEVRYPSVKEMENNFDDQLRVQGKKEILNPGINLIQIPEESEILNEELKENEDGFKSDAKALAKTLNNMETIDEKEKTKSELTEFKNIGFFIFKFPIKTNPHPSDDTKKSFKKQIFVLINNKGKAEIDGLLRFPLNSEVGFYSLPQIIKNYIWPTFQKWIPYLFDKTFDDYLDGFNDLRDYHLIVETKNSSDLFYLSYQINRCYNHHRRNLLRGKKVIALMAFHFKDSLIEKKLEEEGNQNNLKIKNEYEQLLLEKLKIMINKGIEKIIMLNISEDHFMDFKYFKESEYDENFMKTEGVLEETKGELKKTKGELEETKGVLEETKGVLEETKGVLEETKGELEETKGELKKIKELTDLLLHSLEISDEETVLRVRIELKALNSKNEDRILELNDEGEISDAKNKI